MVRAGSLAAPGLLVVAGPTASGKSSIAVALAKHIDSEILNIDSVQVYRGCKIGSAQPQPIEMCSVTHHLVATQDPCSPLSAADFSNQARPILDRFLDNGKTLVAVAGTTLYLKAILYGLADLPSSNSLLRTELDVKPLESLHSELSERDPIAAKRIHPNDRLRLIRALEISSGEHNLSQGLLIHGFKEPCCTCLMVVLLWSRPRLYERINTRVHHMLSSGLLEEVAQLKSNGGNDLPVLGSVGYRECCQFLAGRINSAELELLIAQATRRFAKRQLTFWRNEPKKRAWIVRPSAEQADMILGNEPALPSARTPHKGFPVWDWTYQELLERLDVYQKSNPKGVEIWYLNAARLFETLT